MHMLLPALSRLVGVISRHGGYWGTPSPSLWNEISETVCIDKPTSIGGAVPIRLLARLRYGAAPSVRLLPGESAGRENNSFDSD